MSMIVCYAKCWACQFGHHPGGKHTWMDAEDIEFDRNVEMPTTPEEWAALAEAHPCACRCSGGPGGCQFIPGGAS